MTPDENKMQDLIQGGLNERDQLLATIEDLAGKNSDLENVIYYKNQEMENKVEKFNEHAALLNKENLRLESELASLRSELDLSKKHNLYLTKTIESQSQQIAGYGNEVLRLRSELALKEKQLEAADKVIELLHGDRYIDYPSNYPDLYKGYHQLKNTKP